MNHAAPEAFRAAYQDDRRRPGALPQERRLHGHARRPGLPRADRPLRGAPLRRAAARPGAHRHRPGQHAAHPRPVPDAGRSGRHGDAARSDLRQLRGPAGVRGAGRARSSGSRCSTRRRGPTGRWPIRTAWPATSSRLFDRHKPKLVLFGAPDNPTSQIVPQALAELMLERTAAAGAWLAIDFAYKCQYFAGAAGLLRLVAGRSSQPDRHPLELEVGARPGPAARLDRGRRRRSSTRSSACSSAASSAPTRCRRWRWPGTWSRAIDDGSLRRYVDDANARYREAARVTIAAVDEHLRRPRLVPAGGPLHGGGRRARRRRVRARGAQGHRRAGRARAAGSARRSPTASASRSARW